MEVMKKLPCVVALVWLGCASLLFAQHGVIREYASLAPRPDAVAFRPLFDALLTDTSICAGPDRAYYLTGSVFDGGQAHASTTVDIWRSTDMRDWRKLRTLDLGPGEFISPEIHWLKGSFWLALGRAGGGTDLLRFESADLATSAVQHKQITSQGADPSIFLDDDGRFYWVVGAGEISLMAANPLDGLAGEPRTISVRAAGGGPQQSVEHQRGAHLAKINGKYHLFVTGRLMRNGLGRTGLPQGVDDVLVAASEKPDGGYGDFYVAFPNAGQTTMFHDLAGDLWATFSGADARAILVGRPGAFRVEQVPATESRWPIGFNGLEKPQRFPFGLMLRPDTSLIYERGMGFARAVPLDRVPGQRADVPWIRDTFIMVGPDGNYYLTGTSGNMDGINLWKSADLKRFEFVKQVWTPEADPSRWYNNVPDRLFWAPELHYIHGTYWIAFCISAGKLGKNGLLKSISGRAEGPFELAFPENHGVDQRIDASLFEDTDGSVYYVWEDGMIRKLNAEMNGFDGDAQKILPTDGQRVGYEGATLVKIGSWYVLTAAEWNGGTNRSDGTYDMMYSCSKNLLGPYKPRRVAVPHAGHGALFKDKSGGWNAGLFGNDRTAPFRAMPGFVPIEVRDTGDDLLLSPAHDDSLTIHEGDGTVPGVQTVQALHIRLDLPTDTPITAVYFFKEAQRLL
jgi:beta-xylosidase